MWKRLKLVLSMSHVILFVIAGQPAKAQYTTASLGGRVIDTSGAVIPEGRVTVQNKDTGLAESMESASDGSFLFPVLPVGTYQLTVERSGFKTYVQSGIVLTVNHASIQQVAMEVGAISQQGTVSANAVMLDTHTATVAQLVGQRGERGRK